MKRIISAVASGGLVLGSVVSFAAVASADTTTTTIATDTSVRDQHRIRLRQPQ